MIHEPAAVDITRERALDALRAAVAVTTFVGASALPFGVAELDCRLGAGGIDGAGLHEVTAASVTTGDDAAATLFVAGIAARFAASADANIAWALTRFDLYAPGLEQAGLPARKLLYLQGRDETEVLALAEDALRERCFAAVIAEVKVADQTAGRRLQLAAADSRTPMLLLRRWARTARDPLERPSAAMTRWRIACAPSVPLPAPGVGRGCWAIELVRQRNGHPFSIVLEACDDTGRLALPATALDRAPAQARAASRAA
jgi:protein ImuA